MLHTRKLHEGDRIEGFNPSTHTPNRIWRQKSHPGHWTHFMNDSIIQMEIPTPHPHAYIVTCDRPDKIGSSAHLAIYLLKQDGPDLLSLVLTGTKGG